MHIAQRMHQVANAVRQTLNPQQHLQHASYAPDDWQEQPSPGYQHTRGRLPHVEHVNESTVDDDRPEPIGPNAPQTPPNCEHFGEDQYILSLWHTWQDQGREIVRELQYVDAQDARQETAVNIWQRAVSAISQDRKPRVSQRHVLTVLRREANKITRQREDIAHADETIAADARERLIELKMRAQQEEHMREVQRALIEVNSQKPPAPVLTMILD